MSATGSLARSARNPLKSGAGPFVQVLVALTMTLSSVAFASEKARSFTIHFPGGSARVVVPKKFEPLLPDSVYPNRRRPIPARGCPVVVVENIERLVESAEPFLLERGFLVVEMPHPDARRIDLLLTALSRHPEANPSAVRLVVRNSSSALDSPRVSAVAIFDPKISRESAEAESRCLPVALFLRTSEATPSAEPTATFSHRPECVSEKWYSGETAFPREAFRDAAEWLAASAP